MMQQHQNQNPQFKGMGTGKIILIVLGVLAFVFGSLAIRSFGVRSGFQPVPPVPVDAQPKCSTTSSMVPFWHPGVGVVLSISTSAVPAGLR